MYIEPRISPSKQFICWKRIGFNVYFVPYHSRYGIAENLIQCLFPFLIALESHLVILELFQYLFHIVNITKFDLIC